jgi:hypothetical protein
MFAVDCDATKRLTAEAVQSTTLTFQRVDDVHGCDGLSFRVLRVGDGISDDVLEEDLEHSACLFVDQTRDTLHATTTSKTTNGRLCDALDVITQNLSVTFRSTLSQTLATLSATRHDELRRIRLRVNSARKTADVCLIGS